MQDSFTRIYSIVRQIPPGQVSSYGTIAALAGNPRWSRVVGYAMRACRLCPVTGFCIRTERSLRPFLKMGKTARKSFCSGRQSPSCPMGGWIWEPAVGHNGRELPGPVLTG